MDKIIYKYFDELSDGQKHQIELLYPVYKELNDKINVISRKDIDNIYTNHILHSMSIAKVLKFNASDAVLDLGCGGGFPGVPLAILFPETEFTLVDSIGKKITVVREVVDRLGLRNVIAVNGRAENVNMKFDYVVSRAVTSLSPFMGWSWSKIKGGEGRGILYLKGGDISEEIEEGVSGYKDVKSVETYNIAEFFEEEFFETKKILYIQKK